MRTDMSERDLLLGNILRVPEDDTARLVYADWLEEHGEWRYAAFIRAAVANPKSGGGFVGGHDSLGWYPGTHEVGDKAAFNVRRGFIEGIELPTADFLTHAAAIFSQHPVTSVRLTDVTRPYRTGAGYFRWWWFNPETPHTRDGNEIPSPLYERVRGIFETEQLAWDTLHRECIALGRELAAPRQAA
jgi:uncharacterized protein (TIGR02996 family)